MAETLYRKYRPQTFADLVGQRHVRVTLEHALVNNRLAHAYLFTGPRGIGKTTTARILARAVNCLERGDKAEPCNTCANCQAILHGRSLDIMEVDAASQTGVENVRENIIQSARSYPTTLKMKVFIIDEVHMLSLAAFNALLKLIEEPPAYALFILATTEIHRVPETIISRTQRFDFQRVGLADSVERLGYLAKQEKRRLGTGVAERIARYAGGSLRDAESVLGQVFAFADQEITNDLLDTVLPRSDYEVVLTVIEALIPGRAAEAIQVFHTYVADGGDIMTFTQDVLSLTRLALLLSLDPSATSFVGQQEDAATLSRLQSMTGAKPQRFLAILEAFTTALRQIPSAAIEELPVEMAVVTVCQDGPTSTAISTPPPPLPSTPTETSPKTKTLNTKPSATPPKRGQKSMSLSDATTAWNHLQNGTELPPGLMLSIKQAIVTDVEGETIVLTVPYSLHADRLNAAKNAQLIRERLAVELGPVQFRVMIDPALVQDTLPPKQEETPPTPRVTNTPPTLVAQTVPVTTGNELWDSLVSSL